MSRVTNNNKKKRPGKRGPKGSFLGYKLDFLLARADAFQTASDNKTTNYFYDTITCDFIAKYGESEPFGELVGVDDPSDPVDMDFGNDVPAPTAEEAAASAKIFRSLRKVRHTQPNFSAERESS